MNPVVELVRVSTEGQATEDRQGIPAQRTTNRETCSRFHLHVVETVEIIESGTTVATSAEMGRVLDMIREGRVRGIVLAAYDRLFRPDRWTDLAILQVIAEAGAHIYVPAGPIDLQTEIGFVQASVNNLLAGLERRRIRERTVRAKDELRKAGRLASGKPPYGMAYSREAGWSYTSEIEVVKAIYGAFMAGERRASVLADRFALPVTQVRAILRRPLYAGWAVYPSRQHPEKRDLRGWPAIHPDAPDGAIRAETGLPPAIDLRDFLEAQRIIEQRAGRRSLTRAAQSQAFLYRGMLLCSCGRPIYGLAKVHHGHPRHWYACKSVKLGTRGRCPNQHMTRHRVEAGLDRVVRERLMDPDFIEAAVLAHNEALAAPVRSDSEALAHRRRELEARRSRILEAFFGGLISRAVCDEQVAQVDAQLGRIPAALPPKAPIDHTDAREVAHAFRRWRSFSWKGRREILEALAPVFVLHRYMIQGVHLYVPQGGGSRTATPEATPHLYIYLGVAA